MRRLPAEWEHTDAILIAWPHADTDWAYMLDDAERCYVDMAAAIVPFAPLIVVAPDVEVPRRRLSRLPQERIRYFEIPTNDTWTRDYGPITVIDDDRPLALDFQFNGWGLKFAADLDNLVTQKAHELGAFCPRRENHLGITLEGGSIETDGRGTLLTTSECLLSPNRNGDMSREEFEELFADVFGIEKVNWLDHGFLLGDDTDSHIDTLARIVPDNNLLYVTTDDKDYWHYEELTLMEEQLRTFTDIDGTPYRMLPLPLPNPIYDENGERLPATYANYLVVNGGVVVPTYGQPDNDILAVATIKKAFPHHEIRTVDCLPLIRQHGSLHCSTMQIIL